MRRNNGFTLIELMIVLMIIGILAAIAIPNFIVYKAKNDIIETVKSRKTIGHELLEKYRTHHDAIKKELVEKGYLNEANQLDLKLGLKNSRVRLGSDAKGNQAGPKSESNGSKPDMTFDTTEVRRAMLASFRVQRDTLDRQRRLFETHHPESKDLIDGIKHEILELDRLISQFDRDLNQ